MSLLDCPKCWEVYCSCGYTYKSWTSERIREVISAMQKELDTRETPSDGPELGSTGGK